MSSVRKGKDINHHHHEQFKQWVLSLSVSDLQKALTFSCLNENDKDSCFWIGGNDNGVHSHEYDLLLQMIQSQAPLPIPIHPR